MCIRDRYSILEINKNTKQIGYKLALEKVIENVKKAIEKIVITEDLPVYKAILNSSLEENGINLFNINEEEEIKNILSQDTAGKINLYKIKLKKGTNAIDYTNIMFFDNQNKTLPLGQDISTNILVDISKIDMKLDKETEFKIVQFEDKNDDFSKINIKTVKVHELKI